MQRKCVVTVAAVTIATGLCVRPGGEDMPTTHAPRPNALSLRELRAGRGGRTVLAGLSLDVPAGQAVALVGGPGSGHLAAVDAACGLLPLSGGRVFADGRDVSDAPPHRRGLARVSFGNAVTLGTVGRTVRIAARGHAIGPVLAASGLSGQEAVPVAGLPPGLRRCVAVAAAAASASGCLLLQEPLAGLDAQAAAPVLAALSSLAETGLAMLMATGDAEAALRVADRVVTMAGGVASQAGWSREVYEHPAQARTASLLGEINRLPGRVVAEEDDLVTSTSIAKLAALSAQLRKSVAGFRLPDYGAGTATLGTKAAALPAAKEATNLQDSGRPRKASGVGA